MGIKKSTSLLIVAILIFSLMTIVFSINTFSSQVDYLDNLQKINEVEIENVSIIINNSTEKLDENKLDRNMPAQISQQSNKLEVERYFPLYDYYGNKYYLYIEYINNGYAIYDRLGEFIYEKSFLGCGPFDQYSEDAVIYFVGPFQYYTKSGQAYVHALTDEKITKTDIRIASEALNDMREEYKTNQKDELSLNAARSSSTDEMFFVGNKLNDDLSTNASMYFVVKALGMSYGYEEGNTYQLWSNPEDNGGLRAFKDALTAKNHYGSCGFVALSTMMVYYDRLKMSYMIRDYENWNLMYDKEVEFVDSEIGAYLTYSPSTGRYTGNLSSIPKNYLTTEFLHQELLYLKFPEIRNQKYNSQSFGSKIIDRRNAYNLYCDSHGVKKYPYESHSGTFLLPEKLSAGNPCLVALNSGAPGINGGHAAVAYAFTGKHVWWGYTVSSVTCDYGYDTSITDAKNNPNGYNFMAVDVNANFVSSNECIKVYDY